MTIKELKEGYYIFQASSIEERGLEMIATLLMEKINKAEKSFDIEFLSNAKIDADSGGSGRSIYFGYQCCILKRKK